MVRGITPTTNLPVGVIALTATQTDPAGNTSAQVTGSREIDLDVATIDEVVTTLEQSPVPARWPYGPLLPTWILITERHQARLVQLPLRVVGYSYGALTDGEVELSVTQSDGGTTSGVFKRTVVIDTVSCHQPSTSCRFRSHSSPQLQVRVSRVQR